MSNVLSTRYYVLPQFGGSEGPSVWMQLALQCLGRHSCRQGIPALIAATSSVTPTPDFLKPTRKTTWGLTATLKGVAWGWKQRRRPSLLLISTIWWSVGQCTPGVTWTDESLTWRTAFTHEVRSQCKSWPGLLEGCALQRLERTKQQQNYFHSDASDSGRGRQPGAVDKRVRTLLMTPRSCPGWSCPSPLSPHHQGHAGHLPRPWCASWGSWPQEGWWGGPPKHPQPMHAELGRTVHGRPQEEADWVSSISTPSFTGLCNAPFNHQTRIWMQMCPLCNGVSKILCCLQPLFQAVRLPSPHDELECQILITKSIISTLSSRCVAADSCLTSRFLLLRNLSCNPGLQLYQFCEWLRNDKNPEKLPGVWAHLDPLPWFARMGGKKLSSKDRMAGVILAKPA